MFKSLLRTLPTLSGNFTLSCNVDDIYKDSSNEYHAYIRTASIMPLQNNMFRKPITVNLINGRYEYDVAKYYYLYSNVFYKENYSYLKNDYNELDLTSNYTNNDSRNKDYEFGCKRIQYSQHNRQFNFYAPIYINDINDLPEYFSIEIHLNDHLTKTIKVYINKQDSLNYLKQYLIKYVKQIDDRVIFFLPETKQATYFGIDVKEGGIRCGTDNVIGVIFDNQQSINNFDYTICQGFERNKMIMRQIIPLSFSFNINDIFSKYEQDFFKFSKIKITGHYYNKLDIQYDFFDFNIDYYEYTQQYNRYDSNLGKFVFDNGYDTDVINIMNVSYPSLNEGMHTRYRFSNKMTPIYCKFKMMLSSDNDPYVINLSYGYSHLQYPNIKYGYFPTTFKNIIPKLIISDNDLKLPIGKNKSNYYIIKQLRNNNPYIDTENLDKCNKLISNYCSYWYKLWRSEYENLDNMIKDNIWADVKYNYAYLNGVLYNFNNSLEKYNIDKFTVLLNVDIHSQTLEEINDNIKRGHIVLSYSDDNGIPSYNYNSVYNALDLFEYGGVSYAYGNTLYNNHNLVKDCYINYNICMKKDIYGSYIKVDDYDVINKYYRYSDLEKIFISNNLTNALEILKNNQLNGYILLDGINNANYFETYTNAHKEEKTRLMLWDEIFDTNSIRSKYYWLSKKLYMSTVRSSKKILIKSIYDEISDNESSYGKIAVYLKESLIDINRLIVNLKELHISDSSIQKIIINLHQYKSYTYIPYANDNGIEIENFFIEKKDDTKNIYVDTYNLNKYIKEYNELNDEYISDISGYYKEEYFVSILNKDHLEAYLKDLSKDENGISTILMQNIFDVIYVKERIWNITDDEMKCKDIYYPLKDIMEYVYFEMDEFDDIIKKDTTNIDKIKWLLKHISNTRNQANKFVFKCTNIKDVETEMQLDLCFKKQFVKLDYNLYKLLKNNFLYLYTIDDSKVKNTDNWTIYSNRELSELDSSVYIKDINEFLMPLFKQPYINDADIRSLNKFIENNKIKNFIIKEYDDICFKEIDILKSVLSIVSESKLNEFNEFFQSYENEFISSYVVNNLLEKNSDNDYDIIYKLEFLKDAYKEIFYNNIVKTLCKMELYSKYDILNTNYNKAYELFKENANYRYNNDIHLNIYEKDNVRYGFYLISITIDNTNNSFYIEDDYGMNIMFDKINGLDVSKDIIMNNFRILYHFLKINIFNDFANNIGIIVFPTENNIKIRYASTELPKDEEYKFINLKKKDTDIIYNDIKILKKDRNIKLLRYFNYVEPLLQKVSYIRNSWEHKFKTSNIFYGIENNILNRSSLNIYKYNPLYVCTKFDKNTNEEEFKYVSQFEYKHFNDNELYNLEESIIIEEKKLVTYEKTLELQTNENIFNIFKKYVVSKHNNKDIMLFLFNKYKVEFLSKPDKLTSNKSDKLYNVTYKFTLI